MTYARSLARGAAAVALVAGVSQAADLWSVYQPACSSNGIPDEQCRCIQKLVVDTHGEAAARYVGLDMTLRYDEASVILEQIGEDKAFAAADTFDVALNKDCTSGRLARLRGESQAAGTGVASVSSEAAAAAMQQPRQKFSTFDAFSSVAPVLDLRRIEREAIADVTLQIKDEVLHARPNQNMRDYLGFYEVVDANGGIDTNGDGQADLRPGDGDYASAAQRQMLSTKLYFQKSSGSSQVLGEVRFRNKIYAPVVRIQGAPAGGNSEMGQGQLKSMQDLMKMMSKPRNLYFVYPAANPGGANHLIKLDNNSIGFASSPSNGGGSASHDDAIFGFRVGN